MAWLHRKPNGSSSDARSAADDEGDPGDDVPDQHKGSSRPDQNGSQPMESVSLDISTQGIGSIGAHDPMGQSSPP
ncbi:hypothetical protein Hgul01_05039 [Herpetosiphon gulosus]|uniref:Uncharacterized protein n=1 Tax=Herpetosiphon gulosus TaxID=1973496 RepID=A0ABP9X773_9CHLR